MSAMPIERANLPHLGQQQSPAIQGGFPLVVQDAIAHISLSNNRNVHLLRRDVSDVTSEVKGYACNTGKNEPVGNDRVHRYGLRPWSNQRGPEGAVRSARRLLRLL